MAHVNLHWQHFLPASFALDSVEIEGSSSDYAKDTGDGRKFHIDEDKLINALPEGFLRVAPTKENTYLAVFNGDRSYFQYGLKNFADYKAGYAAYVLELVKE